MFDNKYNVPKQFERWRPFSKIEPPIHNIGLCAVCLQIAIKLKVIYFNQQCFRSSVKGARNPMW